MGRAQWSGLVVVLLVLLLSLAVPAEETVPAPIPTTTQIKVPIAYPVKYAVPSFSTAIPSRKFVSQDEAVSGELYRSMNINFQEMTGYCDNPEKLKEFVLNKMHEALGQARDFCAKMEEDIASCQESQENNCKNMFRVTYQSGMPEKERKWSEVQNTCPPDKNAYIQACFEQNKQYVEDQQATAPERCRINWKQYGEQNYQQCSASLQQQNCDVNSYVEQCLKNWNVKPEDFKPMCLSSDEVSSKKASCKGTTEEVKEGDCVKDIICKPDDPEGKCSTDYKPVCDGATYIIYTNECLATNFGGVKGYFSGTCEASRKSSSKMAYGKNGELLDSYDDFVNECKRQWDSQEKYCEQVKKSCLGENDFIQNCVQQEEQNVQRMLTDVKYNCEKDALVNIRNRERECQQRNEQVKQCLQNAADACNQRKEEVKKCKDQYTEEKFTSLALQTAQKQCSLRSATEQVQKVKDIFAELKGQNAAIVEVAIATTKEVGTDGEAKLKSFVLDIKKVYEDDSVIVYKAQIKANRLNEIKDIGWVVDAKILSVAKEGETTAVDEERIANKVVERLLTLLQQAPVSDEFSFFLQGQASDIVQASDVADKIEVGEKSKGFFYKLLRTLGFMKKAEAREIAQLQASAQKLAVSIDKLGNLATDAQDPVYKAVLTEQIEELKKRQNEINELIGEKQKKAGLI